MADTTSGKSGASSIWAGLALAVPVAIGIGLRVYMLPSQIVIEDEWHAIAWAGSHSLPSLWVTPSFDANSVPYNLWCKLLLLTQGMSEVTLRMPALVSGLLLMILYLGVIRRLFSFRVAVIATTLLAISPFLIFYSRYARGYSPALLLSFLAVMAGYGWLNNGDRGLRIVYLVAGTLAVWAQMSAILIVWAPLMAACCMRKGGQSHILTVAGGNGRRLLKCGTDPLSAGVLLMTTGAVIGVSMWNGGAGFIGDRVGQGALTWAAIPGLAQLISGVSVPVLPWLFLAASAYGLVLLRRRNRFLAMIVVCMLSCCVLFVVVCRTVSINLPIVILRYSMGLLPFVYLCVALAVDRWGGAGRWRGPGLAAIIIITLVWCSPLRQLYRRPNNFSLAFPFQASYAPLTPDNYSPPVAGDDFPDVKFSSEMLPAFYHRLSESEEAGTIIEYPVLAGFYNLGFFYQQVHGQEVIAGYTPEVDMVTRLRVFQVEPSFASVIARRCGVDTAAVWESLWVLRWVNRQGVILPDAPPAPTEATYPLEAQPECLDQCRGAIHDVLAKMQPGTDVSIGQFLLTAESAASWKFRQMVNLLEPDAVRATGARYLILHKDLFYEYFAGAPPSKVRISQVLMDRCRREFGVPYYEDGYIIVHAIRPTPAKDTREPE